MQRKLLFCLCALLIAGLIVDAIPAEEIRVIGGVNNDYKDADGRI